MENNSTVTGHIKLDQRDVREFAKTLESIGYVRQHPFIPFDDPHNCIIFVGEGKDFYTHHTDYADVLGDKIGVCDLLKMASKEASRTLTGNFLINSLGFTEEEVSENQKVYMHGVWEVTIIDSNADNPIVLLCVNDSKIKFPGAHTEKDLTDLILFYYGEDEYGKIFYQ